MSTDPTLRQLRYLVVTVEHGSVTEAASALGVAQPTLSQQLRALEDAVGTTLLERTPRGVVATPAGRALLPGARTTLGEAAAATARARAVAGLADGELHLATVLSVALGVVPSVLTAWHRAHPHVRVVLHEYADLSSFAAALEPTGPVVADLGIGPLPRAWAGPSVEIGAEEFVVIVPPDDALAARRTVRLAELADRLWVHYGRGHGLADVVETACAEAGFAPEAAIRTMQTAALPPLVAAGLGVALVPANILTPDFPGAVLRLTPRRRRALSAFARPDPHPVVARFLEVAGASAAVVPPHLAQRLR